MHIERVCTQITYTVRWLLMFISDGNGELYAWSLQNAISLLCALCSVLLLLLFLHSFRYSPFDSGASHTTHTGYHECAAIIIIILLVLLSSPLKL